jgi:hypothetical protein
MDVFSRISKAIGGSASAPDSDNGKQAPSRVSEKGTRDNNRASRKSKQSRLSDGDVIPVAAFKDNWRAIQVSHRSVEAHVFKSRLMMKINWFHDLRHRS